MRAEGAPIWGSQAAIQARWRSRLQPARRRADIRDMWAWIVGVWIAVSLLLAYLHFRLRSGQPALPPEVETFLLRLETVLARRQPQVEYLGLLPGQFTALMRVHGQETPVSLQGAWRHAQAFPDAFDTMVDRLVADIEEVGLDRIADHDFAGVATWILPQVKGREWLQQHGAFGDAGIVHRPLNDDLVVAYVIDDPHTMVFVCRAHSQRWHKTEADLYHLATANLQRLSQRGIHREDVATGPLLLQSGDGYDAARVLLLDQHDDGLLVAIPDRDVLWVAMEEGQDLGRLASTAQQIAATAEHPVSAHVYRTRQGRLEQISE